MVAPGLTDVILNAVLWAVSGKVDVRSEAAIISVPAAEFSAIVNGPADQDIVHTTIQWIYKHHL